MRRVTDPTIGNISRSHPQQRDHLRQPLQRVLRLLLDGCRKTLLDVHADVVREALGPPPNAGYFVLDTPPVPASLAQDVSKVLARRHRVDFLGKRMLGLDGHTWEALSLVDCAPANQFAKAMSQLLGLGVAAVELVYQDGDRGLPLTWIRRTPQQVHGTIALITTIAGQPPTIQRAGSDHQLHAGSDHQLHAGSDHQSLQLARGETLIYRGRECGPGPRIWLGSSHGEHGGRGERDHGDARNERSSRARANGEPGNAGAYFIVRFGN